MDFSGERLAERVKTISTQIAPRMPTAFVERSFAYYIERVLAAYGIPSNRQTFPTIERYSKRLMPQVVASAATIGASVNAKRGWRGIAAAAGMALLWHHRRMMRGYPALWEDTLSDADSYNVVAHLPAQRTTKQKVVLVAHIDTNFERFSYHPNLIHLTPVVLSMIGAATLLGVGLNIMAGQRDWSRRVRSVLSSAMMSSSLLIAWDEFGSAVVGANDNASGVSVALDIAARLAQTPLAFTDVWLVFTGSEEAGGAGLEAFLKMHLAEVRDAWFVVVNSVGRGELCWGTDHFLSHTSHYQPHPDAVAWAAATAARYPELGVMGYPLFGLDEVSVLQRFGLKAVRIAAVDRQTGRIPHQHRMSDTPDNVDPLTMQKAAAFVWAMLKQREAS